MCVSANDPRRLDAADADSAATPGRFALRREGRREQDALAHGLMSESAEGLRMASELVVDQQARACLITHVEQLTALLEAWSPAVSEMRARK